MKHLRLSKSQWLLIAFAVGIWTYRAIGEYFWPVAGAAIMLAAILFLVNRTVGAVLAALALGLFYFTVFQFHLADLAPRCSQAQVATDVRVDDLKQEFLVKSGDSRAVVSTTALENFGYGDKIRLCFDQENIAVIEPSYKIYLLGKYCSANLVKDPQIELENSGHGMIRSLFEWTKSLSALMKRIFVGEAGVLAKGLILGGSSAFSAETIADLRRSGTSHLVAVSGYNVTIITVQLFKLLRNTVSRRIAFIVTIVFLLAFCVMTGMSASIMRATIFGLLFLVGKMLGRRSAAINALLAAAFLMILINPYILWDVGFQLSFAATFGLVVGGWIFPATSAGGWISSLKSVLQETIFAQIFTLPIILTAFGQVSLLAPVANLLILPLVPTEMLLLGITLATGLISFWAGVFLASVSKVLLDYFLIVIKFIGGLSFAAVSVDQFSALAAVGLYLIIWAGCVYLKRIIDVRQATK